MGERDFPELHSEMLWGLCSMRNWIVVFFTCTSPLFHQLSFQSELYILLYLTVLTVIWDQDIAQTVCILCMQKVQFWNPLLYGILSTSGMVFLLQSESQNQPLGNTRCGPQTKRIKYSSFHVADMSGWAVGLCLPGCLFFFPSLNLLSSQLYYFSVLLLFSLALLLLIDSLLHYSVHPLISLV